MADPRLITQYPERADWWIEQERYRRSVARVVRKPELTRFLMRYTYEDLRAMRMMPFDELERAATRTRASRASKETDSMTEHRRPRTPRTPRTRTTPADPQLPMTWFEPSPRPPFHAARGRPPAGRSLEISSRSRDPFGRELSAMNLPAAGDLRGRPVEAVYQAAKCYGGGPDVPGCDSGYAAKHRDRERRQDGPLAAFEHEGRRWPTETGTAFYDWLWTRSAIARWGIGIVDRLREYGAFSDQFHRAGALACQAKTAAMVAGMGRARAQAAIESPEAWLRETRGLAERREPVAGETAAPSRIYAGVGSRSTPPDVLDRMEQIAEAMARRGWTLRSGAAAGADSAFENGARRAGGPREIWLPWDGFNGRTADGAARIGRNNPRNRDRARQCHPAWHTLSDGVQKLMLRNVHQVLGPGPGSSPPADVVLCWTPNGAAGGGTGHAVRLARRHGIPVVDLGTGDRRALRAAVDAALERGLPPDVAELIAARPRQAAPDAYRILVTGDLRGDEAAALERRLDELAAGMADVAVIAGTDPATGAAVTWAAERGHARINPGPRRDDHPGPEPPSCRAARLLNAKPHVVVECGGDWSAHTQAVRDLAELRGVPSERCEGVSRRPTGIEHHLAHAEAERRRAPDPAPRAAGKTRRRRPSRYDAVDRFVSDLAEPGARIVRAAARRHRVTDPETVRRALFVTNSPIRATLLGADAWTTRDRLENDPLGVLTRGIGPAELQAALKLARSVTNALTRAGLSTAASRSPEAAAEGLRPRSLDAPRPRRAHQPTR